MTMQLALTNRNTTGPQAISVYCLGQFTITNHGNPVEIPLRTPCKPLDLLKMLIAFGGRLVPEKQLSETLWRNAEGDFAHRSFATALYRLRHLLGDKEAIKLRAGAVSLNDRHCWVDVWAFSNLLDKMAAVCKTQPVDMQQLLSLHRQAMQLYRGPFLGADKDGAWAIPLRERLRNRFLHHLFSLGQQLGCAGRCDEAIEFFEAALDVDPYAEECYRQLMICNMALAHRTEAMRLYERCCAALATGFDVEPSAETRTLYADLRSGDMTTKVARACQHCTQKLHTASPYRYH